MTFVSICVLQQSQVPCYPERKIEEFNTEITKLQKEYKLFINKLREYDPKYKEQLPWEDRPYKQQPKTDLQGIQYTTDGCLEPYIYQLLQGWL